MLVTRPCPGYAGRTVRPRQGHLRGRVRRSPGLAIRGPGRAGRPGAASCRARSQGRRRPASHQFAGLACGVCAGDRLATAGSAPGIRCPASSPAEARCPIRTHVQRPKRPPLLYFPAVLTVRTVRILLLTCGAMGIRTPDLLHAIWRQHIHPRPSPQVTVSLRPCAATPSACVAALPCCTAPPTWSNQSCPQRKP
jgi:hypothetical protein